MVPVLEMALDSDRFVCQFKELLQRNDRSGAAYVLLKIAMEIQDNQNMVSQQQSGQAVDQAKLEQRSRMQKLRFKRYAQLFKEGLALTLRDDRADLFDIFYTKNTSKLVSSQLRKELMQFCYPDFFKLHDDMLDPLCCYFIILEANDNPYAI